jgi:hypothetical protein
VNFDWAKLVNAHLQPPTGEGSQIRDRIGCKWLAN